MSDKESGPPNQNGSSLNLEENVSGLLCYLGAFITGIIFLILEKKSPFVRFHAMQSIVLFVGLWIVYTVISFFPFAVYSILNTLLSILSLVLWIVLMVKAYQKEKFKLPVVGDMAESFLSK